MRSSFKESSECCIIDHNHSLGQEVRSSFFTAPPPRFRNSHYVLIWLVCEMLEILVCFAGAIAFAFFAALAPSVLSDEPEDGKTMAWGLTLLVGVAGVGMVTTGTLLQALNWTYGSITHKFFSCQHVLLDCGSLVLQRNDRLPNTRQTKQGNVCSLNSQLFTKYNYLN
jgi:hypothetical protein